MNKLITSSLAVIAAVSAISSAELSANAHTIEVNNLSRDKIDVYVRGEGAESPAKPHAVLEGKVKKNVKHNRPEAYMDIVVVSHGSTPDWNPTGGACKHLLTTTDHTVVVDDSMGGLKFSCETVK